jgi:hypothetical protein
MSEPKFTGVWIPAGVFQRADLSMSAKLLYGVVAGLDGSDGCYASNSYLQRHLGLSERSIQVVLKELDDACLIRRENFDGKRIIRTVESIALSTSFANSCVTHSEEKGCKKLRGRVQKTAGEGCKKLHPYNKEDNKEDITTPTPSCEDDIPWTEGLPFDSKAFSEAWASWIEYRKEMKKPLKPTTVKAQWKELVKWGEQKSIEAIEQSIKMGWQGLFEPRQNGFNQYNKKPLTANDHNNGF